MSHAPQPMANTLPLPTHLSMVVDPQPIMIIITTRIGWCNRVTLHITMPNLLMLQMPITAVGQTLILIIETPIKLHITIHTRVVAAAMGATTVVVRHKRSPGLPLVGIRVVAEEEEEEEATNSRH